MRTTLPGTPTTVAFSGTSGQHNGVGRHAGAVPHLEGTQHLGSAADQHIVADRRMALALVLAGAAQRNTVVKQDIVADLGSLTDDNAHAVVDHKAPADLGSGVDLNAGALPVPLGLKPRQKEQLMLIEKMRDPMPDDGVDARIEQEDLQLAPSRRIAGLIGRQKFS